MSEKNCACGKQIVWFFDSGRGCIIACKNCEITFHYETKICPYCNEEVTEFDEVLK